MVCFRKKWRGFRLIETTGDGCCPYPIAVALFRFYNRECWPSRWGWHGCETFTHLFVHAATLTRAVLTDHSRDVLDTGSLSPIFFQSIVPYTFVFAGGRTAPHLDTVYSFHLGGFALNVILPSVRLSFELCCLG